MTDRWAEYITELYDNERLPLSQNDGLTGNEILKSEVEAASTTMKKGKPQAQMKFQLRFWQHEIAKTSTSS